jgi:hypothetical protein
MDMGLVQEQINALVLLVGEVMRVIHTTVSKKPIAVPMGIALHPIHAHVNLDTVALIVARLAVHPLTLVPETEVTTFHSITHFVVVTNTLYFIYIYIYIKHTACIGPNQCNCTNGYSGFGCDNSRTKLFIIYIRIITNACFFIIFPATPSCAGVSSCSGNGICVGMFCFFKNK